MTDLDQHLQSIAAGDPEAFARWIAGSEFRIRASLRSFAAQVDVESIVQETLLRVWQVAPRVEADGKGDSLVRLAIRIARNLAVSEVRRSRDDPRDAAALERLLHEEAALTHDPTSDPLLRRVIAMCREKLSRKPAMALAARLEARGGVPDETLAAQLGMRVNTFLQNFGRARRQLAECLAKNGVDLEGARR